MTPRKLTYFVATTVDGFISGPNGEFDFFPLEGDHIRAQTEELPETIPAHVREALGIPTRQARFDTVVMGRKTLDPALEHGISHPYRPLRTVVFSRSLPARDEDGLRITAEDPVAVVRALKAEEGLGIWLCGGAQLAGVLADEIDELLVKVNPVLALGGGIRLFDRPFSPRKLALRSHRTFDSGVCWLGYDLLPR